MGKIKVLDCTLRDGGYCNQWEFGFQDARKIVGGLAEAGIDIIECGFLASRPPYDPDRTKFNTPGQAARLFPLSPAGRMYVCMVNFGEYDISCLPERGGISIDGIRVAFHKKDIAGALKMCREIQEKGYKVFVQAMVSLSYTDEEFLSLIRECNRIKPYAFYIVDSFGVMKRKDLMRLFYLVEHNLDGGIAIGYHSHNNMQLAFSNAQALADTRAGHDLIIDSCVYGMGRGAGNLNTELFVDYLNDNFGAGYQPKPLLNIIDSVLEGFHQKNGWGYSLPNYLSAAYNTHPNYAGYLSGRNTLTVEDMDEIFGMMEDGKRASFDRGYIEDLYIRYLSKGRVQKERQSELKRAMEGKRLLLIAPGKSSVEEKERIIQFAGNRDVVSVSVNFAYQYIDTDYIFVSNLRRFRELDGSRKGKCIVTSNIPADGVFLQTEYHGLLNAHGMVKDNAGLMAVKFLIGIGVREVSLAGFDGYSHDVLENYGDQHMAFVAQNAILDAMNEGMAQVLRQYGEEIRIGFLTAPRHITL